MLTTMTGKHANSNPASKEFLVDSIVAGVKGAQGFQFLGVQAR
jgi:hypothetical protein